MMKKIIGIAASDGIVTGRLALNRTHETEVEKRNVADLDGELSRLKSAVEQSVEALNNLYQQSLKEVGEDKSMIFQIHIMMIQDEDFTQAIQKKIKEQHVNAEYAVWMTGKEFAENFAKMDSEYMRGRKTDVIDISRRLICCLDKNAVAGLSYVNEPSILAADELTPSETMKLDKSKILAIITRSGSRTSHSAILSRTIGIPSVVNLGDGFDCLKDGMLAVVDGMSGEVILEPDEATKRICEKKYEEQLQNRQNLQLLLKSEIAEKSGSKVAVNANIGRPEDVNTALDNGADGIGLYRSEFLYMEHDRLPSEEEQVQAYKTVLEKMKGRTVIVRTFDIGADKQVPYLNLPKEANPALGYRAIRICLDRKELFLTQLRALLCASIFGSLKIMFPMITSLEEVRAAKAVLEEAKAELSAEKIEFSPNVKTGIMVETPAAVMLSEELAKECDFFSIGTNDLTQYTLAVDRMNSKIEKLYDQSHPAVLKMIERTAASAHKAGIPVGICGDSAAAANLIQFYKKIGIDELSVAPSSILNVKAAIREMA